MFVVVVVGASFVCYTRNYFNKIKMTTKIFEIFEKSYYDFYCIFPYETDRNNVYAQNIQKHQYM